MTLRIVTIALAVLEALAVAAMSYALLTSIDHVTGIDRIIGWAALQAVLLLFAITEVPALILSWRRRAPRAALVLALAFPLLLAALLISV
jgi:hypothetical protein